MDNLLRFTTRNHITANWLKNNPNAEIECWFCKSLIPQTDPKQKYCNRSCAKKYFRKIHKEIIYGTCWYCDKEFIVLKKGTLYCNINCQRGAARLRKGIPRIGYFTRNCRMCKEDFTVTFQQQRYCSVEHFSKYRRLHHHDSRYKNGNVGRDPLLTEKDIQDWNRMREKFWFKQ